MTGRDLVWGLRGFQGEEVLLPDIVLKQGTTLLLDGMSVGQVATLTGSRLTVLEPTAEALVSEVRGDVKGSRIYGKTGGGYSGPAKRGKIHAL